MTQAPEIVSPTEGPKLEKVADAGPVVRTDDLQATAPIMFDVRSRQTIEGLVPSAVVGNENVVFRSAATRGTELPTVAVVENPEAQAGRPSAQIYNQTKVERTEGFYQSAARITPGFSHQERLALAHAMKGQYAEEVKTRPELAGRMPDGSDMRVGTQLLREDNFDAVMEKLKKISPEIAAKVLEKLTKQKEQPATRDPYSYSGSPEDGPNVPARVNPAVRVEPAVVNPPVVRPVVRADVPPVVVDPARRVPGSNDGRGGAPAPGGDVPLKLPTTVLPGPGLGERVVRTVQDKDRVWLQQTDSFGCAAFSLEMAVADWQGRRPTDQGAKRLENTPVAGTTMARAGQFPGQLNDMADLAQRQGLNARPFGYNRVGQQTLQDMNAELDKGNTALVRIINPTTGNNHWVYAVGRTADGKYLIADPSRRNNQRGGAHSEAISATQLLGAMNRGGAGFVSVSGTPEQVAVRRAASRNYTAAR